MKLISNHFGFNALYTSAVPDGFANGIPTPSKTPYLILTSNIPRIDTELSCLGLKEAIVIDGIPTYLLTITGTRKVIQAITAICKQRPSDHLADKQAIAHVIEFKERLERYYEKPQRVARRSKSIDNVERESLLKPSHKNAPLPGHTVYRVKRQGKTKSHKEFLKLNESGRRISEIEAFNGQCYRLLLNNAAPKVKSVHGKENKAIGVLSREIPNFQSMHDYYCNSKEQFGEMKSPLQRDLIAAGIGKILAAAYCEEENDLHGGNIGYDPIARKATKIDHDQAMWPITAKYRGKDCNRAILLKDGGSLPAPCNAFPITQRDISNFPHLMDAQPYNFPDKIEFMDLDQIQSNKAFIQDVFLIFFKRILIDELTYSAIARSTITSERLQHQVVQHKVLRTQLLHNELIKNKKFVTFIHENPQLKNIIMEELTQYNQDLKNHFSLTLNLDEMGAKFDTIQSECEAYYSSLQEDNSVITDLLEVGLDDYLEEDTEQALNKIQQQVVSLNRKLGFFGGKNRFIQGEKIKVANGVAEIADFLEQYSNRTISAEIALEKIIHQAKKSKTYQGHTWFNRRQYETSRFYEQVSEISLSSSKAV